LAPSHDGNGTNGLLLAPPKRIAPCYGPGSYLQHLSQAMARRVDVNVVHLEGLARMTRRAGDLDRAAGARPGGKRYAFLAPHALLRYSAAKSAREESMTSSGIRQALAAAEADGACRPSRRWRWPSATTSSPSWRSAERFASRATART
jgi:hypothetical protein